LRTSGRFGPIIPLNWYLSLLALVVLAFSLAELATSFGALPGYSASSFFASQRIISLMNSLGYVSLFALMTLESASLPIPSEVVLPFAGYLVYLGVMNLWAALAVSTAAAVAGALIDYYLALLLGRVFVERFLRLFNVDHGSIEIAERWFNQKGAWTIFGARFLPLIRSVISLPAGLFRMPLWLFVLFTGFGCLLWNAFLIYTGYATGALWEKVVGSSFALFVDAVFVVLAAVSAAYLAYYGYARSRR